MKRRPCQAPDSRAMGANPARLTGRVAEGAQFGHFGLAAVFDARPGIEAMISAFERRDELLDRPAMAVERWV